jgi:hypothetical protein
VDKELADLQEASGVITRFMDDEEADGMVDNMASEDTSLLKVLVDPVDKCVQSGDKRQYKEEALKLLGIDTSGDKVEERKLMKRMATAHRRYAYYSDAAEKAAPTSGSYTFEYDEEKK